MKQRHRRRKFSTVKRCTYHCEGGPFDKYAIKLSACAGAYTLPFTARGQSGYYARVTGGNVVKWHAS